MNLNTVVVVGDRFDPGMFRPEEFFGGAPDSERTVLVGPIAQFSYHSGRCGFSLSPNRIDLSVQSPHIMPDELCSAAEHLTQSLEKIRKAVQINGIGLNCDAKIDTIEHSGADICNRLSQVSLLTSITGAEVPQCLTRVRYEIGNLLYSVNIEPEAQSQGKNLWVAVNGHQDIVPTDELSAKIVRSLGFRQHVGDLHERIRNTLL